MEATVDKFVMPEKGRKLLNRVIRHIRTNPKRFNMYLWIARSGGKTPCGTVGCIAGWCTVLSLDKVKKEELFKEAKSSSEEELETMVMRLCGYSSEDWFQDVAQSLLGITHKEAEVLFHVEGWPKQFDLNSEKTQKGKVEVAVKRIRHFMKTGE